MKPFLRRKETKNLIVIFALIIMLFTSVPNISYAALDTENGGGILEPIEKFVVYVCDNVMQWLQGTFTSVESIKQSNGEYEYNFRYSPAIIFSGTVPAFDINFIDPNIKGIEDIDDKEIETWLKDNRNNFISKMTKYEWKDYEKISAPSGCKRIDDNITEYHVGHLADTYTYYYVKDGYIHIYFFYEEYEDGSEEATSFYYYETKEKLVAEDVQNYNSTAAVLQNTIATWYNTLRRIALVGLLSVLVYVGIRMVLTSSSQDKAKYKNMLKDWLVALCLLFTLHYIMNVTIVVTNEISDIFSTGESDQLLNKLRTEIYSGSMGQVLAQVIMYVVLVIYTVTFTIQYLKRVIYMAFFTLIAPLITLTYPLDKIKDGQAQAFNMWIKEYIFTALTQVIHLVIYFTLVGSALALVEDYPLYAIIVIMFIKKAEEIIKKMFGFEKSETVSTLGAAATGGLVMNAINKMKGMGGKGGKSGASGGSGGAEETGGNKIRTATGDPLSSLRARIQGTGGEGVTAPITTASTGTNTTGGSTTQSANSGASGQSGKPSRSLSGGAGSIFKKYTGPSVKKILGTTSDLFLGGTGALVGLAAGVAQGDVGSAFTGALAGAAAGKGLRQGVTNKAVSMGNSIKNFGHEFMDTAREGAYGADYAEMVKFKRSSDYQELKKNHKDSLTDENLQTMISAGITQKDAMGKILKNGSDNIEDAIGYYTLAKECPDSIYYDTDKLTQFIEDKLTEDGQNISRAEIQEIVSNMKKYR